MKGPGGRGGPRTFSVIARGQVQEKELTHSDHSVYTNFWNEKTCWKFFELIQEKGEIRWVGKEGTMTLDSTRKLFQEYLSSLEQVTTKDGIASSWFQVFETLKARHSVILNSFGVDTRKVTLATVSDETRVLQVAINYEVWDGRDVKKFGAQFDE